MVPCTSQAAAAIGEARDIADNLRCQPLLDRAADITPAQSPVADEITPLPDPEESNGPAGVIPVIAPDAPARHAQNDRLFAGCDRRKSYSTTVPNGGYLRCPRQGRITQRWESLIRRDILVCVSVDCLWH